MLLTALTARPSSYTSRSAILLGIRTPYDMTVIPTISAPVSSHTPQLKLAFSLPLDSDLVWCQVLFFPRADQDARILFKKYISTALE